MLADDARAVVETRHLIVSQMQISMLADDVAPDKRPRRHDLTPQRYPKDTISIVRYPNDTTRVLYRYSEDTNRNCILRNCGILCFPKGTAANNCWSVPE